MRNLMFTALTVVGFSGVVMAKTAEVVRNCEAYATQQTNKAETARELNGYGCYTSSQYNKMKKLYYIECTMEDKPVEAPYLDLLPLEEEDLKAF